LLAEKQLRIDALARQLRKAHIYTFSRGINTGMMGILYACSENRRRSCLRKMFRCRIYADKTAGYVAYSVN
jgi:hypothetical protein